MTKNSKNIVHIQVNTQQTTLSAAQKQFNTLCKKIEGRKKLLLEWEAAVVNFSQKVAQEYEPLLSESIQLQVKWLQLLDSHYDNSLFNKQDKRKLKHIMLNDCETILQNSDLAEVKAIFNKYSNEDFDTLKQELNILEEEALRELAKEMFNLDISADVDFSTPEKFHEFIEAHLYGFTALEDEERRSFASAKKKTKKQLEKEARQQEEEALASKSVQEVYRKLVAVLHPDREPDDAERERKTELMQRVNTAYGKKDLLKLLALQLEIEQIDVTHLSQMADSRLKHFNKILKDQLMEIEQEINQIEWTYKQQLQLPSVGRLSIKKLALLYAHDIKEIHEQIAEIKQYIEHFSPAETLKVWLKSYKIPI